MADRDVDSGRRRFLTGTLAGVLAAPVVGLAGTRIVLAADKPKISLDDPQAKALKYVHDASKASDNPAFQEGAHCANCLQWTGGDAEWGGCRIFPGKLVNRNGWCTAWAKQG